MRRFVPHVTIFLGAFLLFGVQPMVGNTLLPVFGGTAAVWTVCLCAFQTLLVAGYWYAHGMAKSQEKRGLIWGHVSLLICAAVWVWFVAGHRALVTGWSIGLGAPALATLAAVLGLVGVPYVLLSSNSSLVQAWVARGKSARDVYGLYAVSNAGSFAGLLAYPLLLEPWLTLTVQWQCFAWGLGSYALCVAGLWWTGARETTSAALEPVDDSDAARNQTVDCNAWEWFGLSALSCFLLNGVTAHLCNEVTPLPLLWAVLLALYLLSYIVGFTGRGAKLGPYVAGVTLICVVAASLLAGGVLRENAKYIAELTLGMALIALGGWTIHGRLYRRRPGNVDVTRYYLCIAVGGAVGGSVASLVFPMVFGFVAEYPMALAILVMLACVELREVLQSRGVVLELKWCAMAMVVVLGIFLLGGMTGEETVVARMRNFYGCGRVLNQYMGVKNGSGYYANVFEHNGILHGFQATDVFEREIPTLCFTPHAGGLPIVSHALYGTTNAMRVAVAGMGIGTLAAYGRPSDTYRFYEINPKVAALAKNDSLFTYISDCQANVDIVVDDARRALEDERTRNEPKWDVLIIDVFSGDAIPPHMATEEAFQLYLDRLAPGGVLSLHLTNWHLGLSPVVKAVAKKFDLYLQGYGCFPDKYSHGSYWTFLTREPADFYIKEKHGRVNYAKVRDMELMTDERHSLLPYLSLDPMPGYFSEKDEK